MSQPSDIATRAQGVHLVGSINFDDAETTIRTAAEVLGTRLKRIPDGEVGPRFHWIAFQADAIARTEGIARVGDEPILVRGIDFRPVTLAEGVRAADLTLEPLGYAEAAIDSFAIFSRLKREGVVPAGTRFQVSLPTTVGVVGSFVWADIRAEFESVYEAALLREIDAIVAAIPNDELAIQFDAAVEFGLIEGAGYGSPMVAWFEGDPLEQLTERAARHISYVPELVQVGIHLCYGDVGEKHFVEPKDTANLVKFANRLVEKITRPLNWLHLPVPIERDDEAYFAPLEQLGIGEDTELYLGLVHRQDGEDGAKRRIAAASTHVVRQFGVATECGFGRAPEGTTVPLFDAHRAVSAAW